MPLSKEIARSLFNRSGYFTGQAVSEMRLILFKNESKWDAVPSPGISSTEDKHDNRETTIIPVILVKIGALQRALNDSTLLNRLRRNVRGDQGMREILESYLGTPVACRAIGLGRPTENAALMQQTLANSDLCNEESFVLLDAEKVARFCAFGFSEKGRQSNPGVRL